MSAQTKLRESIKKINLSPREADLRFDEPMAGHTTFKVGGPADLWARPRSLVALAKLTRWAADEGLPRFVLGGGANLLVSDAGIRGLTLDMGGLDGWHAEADDAGGAVLELQAGLPVSQAAARAADAGWAGLDFVYAMPGSVGGAVYMNARCYGAEIGDCLLSVDYLDETLTSRTVRPERASFRYKDTPFMGKDWIITGARFALRPAQPDELWRRMRELEDDRRAKGHFLAPCAGSVFKNNHAFGEPSGKIIDGLGLRGAAVGGAKVSDAHANIIINAGGATAADIKALIDLVRARVLAERGFALEPEVVLAGAW